MAMLLEDILKSVELWLKMIKKPQPYMDPNLDPVLLVSSIASSVLNVVNEESGAPGYVTSTFLNGMSFVDGWEHNFFISKWSMHQLV
ncbi:hypothetical protein ACFX13_038176 [Malus domestica]